MAGNKNSGRKRKPTELKVLEGSFRRDRHGNAPLVSGKFPEAPVHLLEAERQLWETFPKPAWIVESDVAAVDGAVSIYAALIACRQMEQRSVDAEVKLWGRLMTYLSALGLTPADRSKMAPARVDDSADDKWAGLLG